MVNEYVVDKYVVLLKKVAKPDLACALVTVSVPGNNHRSYSRWIIKDEHIQSIKLSL
jgi:hypothetical protein